MTDPTDEELLRFIAAFAGWKNLREHESGHLCGEDPAGFCNVLLPDYTKTLDGFHRDVWPKIDTKQKRCLWDIELASIVRSEIIADRVNAPARERCLALWRALDGKLPA